MTARSPTSSSRRSTARRPTAIPDMVERNPVDISPEQLKFIQDHGSSLLTEKFYTDQMRITAETILPLIGKKMPT